TEYNVRRKKRKIGLPYAGAGVSVSQILAHREKLALNQHTFNKDVMGNPRSTNQFVWPQAAVNNSQIISNRLQGYPENPQGHHLIRCQDQFGNRVMAGSPVVVGGDSTMMVQQSSTPNNISHQQNHQQIAQITPSNPVSIQSHQIIGPNGQIINVQGPINPNQNQLGQMPHSGNGGLVLQGQSVVPAQQHAQPHQHRIFINGQPNEPSGPGRPNIQMIPVSISSQQNVVNHQRQDAQQRAPQQQVHFFNSQPQYSPIQQYDPNKNVRPFNQVINGFRPQGVPGHPGQQIVSAPLQVQQHQQQKMQWHNRMQQSMAQQQPQQQIQQIAMNQSSPQATNVYERVPPLHQHTPSPTVWQEEIKRKKVKLGKIVKNRPYHVLEGCQTGHAPCPNIDVRQIPNESRAVIINQIPHNNQNASSPSFMEDPSGYLAQQTALLNNTINRQTGANGCTGYVCNSPIASMQNPQQQTIVSVSSSQTNEVPLPSNIVLSHMKPQQQGQTMPARPNQAISAVKNQQQMAHNVVMSQPYGQVQVQPNVADSSAVVEHQQYSHCQGCVADSMQQHGQFVVKDPSQQKGQGHSRPSSTPSSSGTSEDPVISSTYSEKHSNQASPDTRPIQGVPSARATFLPWTRLPDTSQIINTSMPFVVYSQPNQMQQLHHQQSREATNVMAAYHNHNVHKQDIACCSHSHQQRAPMAPYTSGVVTTMASGRTVGSNTITSVLAGRANTATVSINSPSSMPGSSTPNSMVGQNAPTVQTQAITVNVSKSPLEMVQSVVSSIQVPHSQQPNSMGSSATHSSPQISPQIVKHSPTGLPPGHILVSSGGQLIMASTGNGQAGVMAPPPPKIVGNQSGMPPISVSPMVTNVTASVTQVIPAVAQQVLGQQTVLVNALPAPFVLQPGVTMTMDGMTVGQNMQIPQLVAGNVIQQQIQIDNSGDPRRAPSLLSPETKKKNKKRKMSSQTVASMLHIAAQQNSGVVAMSQQGFPQQIQMAHSPQGIATGPVMQALTIVPSKGGGPPQIVMNGQAMANANLGTQQIITNSQPAQQINLLQPVNLINGTTGVVQNFPAIQQFIVPNLGGMVVNPDGTATILQDTSNLGMQLQIQNVNGQNVLTPVQNNGMFNGGQSILAAGPAGMVIRAPTSQGKIIQQQQQHSPGAAQFLSPNGGQFVVNGAQFGGQLSPLVASVSPSQQVTFSTSPQQQIRSNNSMQPAQQEYIQMNGQMGQTLMVPCAPAANIAVSSSNQQNTTFVQQNTTIVQQQTTMVANNQQLQNFQQQNNGGQQQQQQQQQQQNQAGNMARTATLNLDQQQNYYISSNDNKQMQAVVVQQQRESPLPQSSAPHYRQSVSTQTAVNQNAQSVTTNTFCQTSAVSAGSPPDTTTLSPLASGGQSPPTADTTTHSGSTDDGLSPAPSNCSAGCSDAVNVQTRPQSSTMAMVHCISSSEPDSADLGAQNADQEWRHAQHPASGNPKGDYADAAIHGHGHYGKKPTPTHVTYAESSTLVSRLQYMTQDQMKSQEAIVSSRNYDKMTQHKRKDSDTLVIVEAHHMHSSLFDDDEETVSGRGSSSYTSKTALLRAVQKAKRACRRATQWAHSSSAIWCGAPREGAPAWPGKVVATHDGDDAVSVKWFGSDKCVTNVERDCLQTLTEGLDAHHQARKKSRTSRKLNSQLEKAIQEAMAELDKEREEEPPKAAKAPPKVAPLHSGIKKVSGRLRSSQR
ncbi:hypothetical protein NQ318_021344, partial [Aromia moschata]